MAKPTLLRLLLGLSLFFSIGWSPRIGGLEQALLVAAREELGPDMAGDNLGFSVALSRSGDLAALGAFGADIQGQADQGAVYLFTRSAGKWFFKNRLSAVDGAAGDRFGISVALDDTGDTLVVGADQADIDGKAGQGAVYIYYNTLNGWTPWAKLAASDGQAYDNLGWSVALSGDGSTIAAGAYLADPAGSTNQGAVYVFANEAALWSQQASLTAGMGAPGDYAGYSVALSDDGSRLAFGAPGWEDSGPTPQDVGAVFIYERVGLAWQPGGRIVVTSGAVAGDGLGRSVAISGDGGTVVAGAPKADLAGKVDQGAAYGFTYSTATGSWSAEQALSTTTSTAGDAFGDSLAVSDDGMLAAVGSYLADAGADNDRGAVDSFTRSGTTWAASSHLTSGSLGAAGDQLGVSVALSDDGLTILGGANKQDVGVRVDQGAAHVWVSSGASQVYQAWLTLWTMTYFPFIRR